MTQLDSSTVAPLYYYQGKFKNGVFTLKTHQKFSVHTTPERFENVAITGQFGFVFEENSGREITWLSWRHHFRKAPIRVRDVNGKLRDGVNSRPCCVFKFLWLSVDRAWIIERRKNIYYLIRFHQLDMWPRTLWEKVLLPSSYFWRIYSCPYTVWPEEITQYFFGLQNSFSFSKSKILKDDPNFKFPAFYFN